MTDYTAEILTDELAFPEAPRWHDARLWFTDQHARAILTLNTTGKTETIASTSDLPGGLGWLPDGRLLVVFMTERRVMQLTDQGLRDYADLASVASFHCNDMLVDRTGRAYVGNFGFDLHGGAKVAPAELIRIDPDGRIEVIARDLVFPNGSVISADGKTLLVAETFGRRISAFALNGQGQIGPRQLWADLGELTPDGICLDTEHALWIASPGTKQLVRIAPGGKILDRCQTRATPYACMLGGEDCQTLFICTSETDDPREAAKRKSGRIEQVRVAVPGAGLP